MATHYLVGLTAAKNQIMLQVMFHQEVTIIKEKASQEYYGVNGPYLIKHGDGHRAACPWHDPLNNVHGYGSINKNKHHKDIVNPENPDICIVYSLSKNHSSLLKNICTIVDRKGPLHNMYIRAGGGAMMNAGLHPVSCVKQNRYGATCELSMPQNARNPQAIAL